jgi:hypothetical protein
LQVLRHDRLCRHQHEDVFDEPSERMTPATAEKFAASIARMREIAKEAGYALLTEGPVHPDHELLDLCADIASARCADEMAWDEWSANFVPAYERES